MSNKTTTTVVIPKGFKLRDDSGVEHAYKQGIGEMPEEHLNHWYVKANNVQVYNPKVHDAALDADAAVGESKKAIDDERQAFAAERQAFEKDRADFDAKQGKFLEDLKTLAAERQAFEKDRADFDAKQKAIAAGQKK